MQDLEHLDHDSLKGALEALLLVSTDAVPATELSKVLGVAPSEAAGALAELAAEYSDANRGFQLREVAGGWRLFTHPAYHDVVERYVLSWDTRRLSQAALETLAVIAYHQPVTREGVKAVRGVNSDGVIGSLKEKGLVREVGRERDRSRAMQYGTTQRFLETFGLRSLRDLPPLEDFAPDEESKRFIRERLSGSAISSTLEEASADIEEEQELLGDAFADDGDATPEPTASEDSPSGAEAPADDESEVER
jgi:segregation and condensation protein B